MKKLKKFEELDSKFQGYQPNDKLDTSNPPIPTNEKEDSLTELVKNVLDACKMDIDEVEESDPDFIPYITDMIRVWHENNI